MPVDERSSATDIPQGLDTRPNEYQKEIASIDPAQLGPAERPSSNHKRAPTKPVIPAIPNISTKPPTNVASSPPSQSNSAAPEPTITKTDSPESIQATQNQNDGANTSKDSPKAHTHVRASPRSWAELLRSKAPPASAAHISPVASSGPTSNDLQAPKAKSLSDALRLFVVDGSVKVSFLEPRGLVNTGNMCYMNSVSTEGYTSPSVALLTSSQVLQILVFCVPFFEFLDQVGKRAVHNFKSDTPLIESM